MVQITHIDLHALRAVSIHLLSFRLITVNLPAIIFDILTVIMEYSPMEAVVVKVIMDSAMAVVGSSIVSAIMMNIEVVDTAGGRQCVRHEASIGRKGVSLGIYRKRKIHVIYFEIVAVRVEGRA